MSKVITEFIDANSVAEITGHSCGRMFLTSRERLEREHDFPTPLPTCLRPLKWRRSAVQSWIDTQGFDTINAKTKTSGPNTLLMQEAATV